MKALYNCNKQTKLKVIAFIAVIYIVIQFLSLRVYNGRECGLSRNQLLKLEVFEDSQLPFAVPGNLSAKPLSDKKSTCRVEEASNKGSLWAEEDITWESIEAANQDVLKGGRHTPKNCLAGLRVAIIIPLRNREAQLRLLLSHMHPIWQRQMLDYQVYTITQAGNGLFNRAKLLNVGVAEASKDYSYDCYVFHDVDLLLENEECMYSCEMNNPRHISHHIDTFGYEPISYYVPCNPAIESPSLFDVLFPSLSGVIETQGFGGVSMMTAEQFKSVNGFSNLYWGWGGEDDDMFHRIIKLDYAVVNPYGTKCSFKMIRHHHERSNAKNPTRFSLLRHAITRMDKEGFNSLRYRVLSIESRQLYTNVTVDIGQPSKTMTDFLTQKLYHIGILACSAKMPWHGDIKERSTK